MKVDLFNYPRMHKNSPMSMYKSKKLSRGYTKGRRCEGRGREGRGSEEMASSSPSANPGSNTETGNKHCYSIIV